MAFWCRSGAVVSSNNVELFGRVTGMMARLMLFRVECRLESSGMHDMRQR
jgi:hypothetical protein